MITQDCESIQRRNYRLCRQAVQPVTKLIGLVMLAWLLHVPALQAEAKVHIVLWFDTEDYILPASDDAALHVAQFLTAEKVRATFKIVGEKARTLERRGRGDVIDALKKHEIGYHSNFHSVQPTPAMYLSNLGWDEGVAEFDRRERPGLEDVQRIFGARPSCYGQPGSSWGPQSFGAMRKWGMQVYLDAGTHVQLDGRPHYYCGVLTLYRLTHQLRASLTEPNRLEEARQAFLAARQKLLMEGGGIISIFYHPCEFVHEQFWDGVNFRAGANPPRSEWRLPPQKSPEKSEAAYRVLEDYVRFIKRFEDVDFITASEAALLYKDRAHKRKFTIEELKEIAGRVGIAPDFQRHQDYCLSVAEIFTLLTEYVVSRANGTKPPHVTLVSSPLGPTGMIPEVTDAVATDASQFTRTASDVLDYISRQGRIPSAVWLGSKAVPPEMFLHSLAQVAGRLESDKPIPATVVLKPTQLACVKYVSNDDPRLWGWVIFPPGFRAPAMMDLARRQAWTLKPAILQKQAARQ